MQGVERSHCGNVVNADIAPMNRGGGDDWEVKERRNWDDVSEFCVGAFSSG